VFVVDRYNPGSSGAPWRTFDLNYVDKDGQPGRPVDGCCFRYGEYASGGVDMTNMHVYWKGKTAVADFGGVRLERTYPDECWTWHTDERQTGPPPTSNPSH
jgi:hypothetical protein